MLMENPLTSAGIEPATFRFVAQYLNHCANAVETEVLQKSVKNIQVLWDVRPAFW